MLAKLKLELKVDNGKIDFRKSSNLQGVIFENIRPEYAAIMHQQAMHPYSQNLVWFNGVPVWQVNCLTEGAYKEIIMCLADPQFSSFTMKGTEDISVEVVKKDITMESRRELFKKFQNEDFDNQLNIKFVTPTAFRQNGMYIILPDLRLIYQSLMMRYSSSSEKVDMNDEDMLNDMVANSFISKHRLQSRYFPVQGSVIPGFTGSITIRFRGNDTIAQFARMLMRFGEYSGIGIKTSMGMGAIRIGEVNNDR